LQPGNAGSVGTLQVTGNYLQGASGSYAVRLASESNYDRLNVTGHASLGGNLTWSSLGGFVPAPGTTFTIITAGQGISGTFASITRPSGLALTLQINGSTVTLSLATSNLSGLSLPVSPNGTVTETFYPFPLFALNQNELSVAEALQSARFSAGVGTDLTNVISALTITSNVTPARVPAALDQFSPLAVPSFSTIAFTLETAQSAQLEQRLAAIRAGSQYELNQQPVVPEGKGIASASAEDQGGKAAYNPPKMVELAHGDRWGAFVTGSGTFAGVDRATDLLSYNFNTGGVTAGVDYRITDDFTLGLYGGYAHTRADFDQNNRLDVDGGKWGLYGTWRKGGFYVDGIVGGGYNSYDLRRGIDFVARTARSNPESWEIDALGGIGYDWRR
jgi:outer membrane autotransporter protein